MYILPFSTRRLGQFLAALCLCYLGLCGRVEAQANKAPVFKGFTAGAGAKLTVTDYISTIAGTGGSAGFGGDGGPAAAAKLYQPFSVVSDVSGNLYIADEYNHRIRKVDAATGRISTIAGTGTPQYGGDGGPATAASFYMPNGLAIDKSGNLYVCDRYNNRVRRIDAVTGIITTYAGVGPTGVSNAGYGGDGGPAASARLFSPVALAFDQDDNLYIADQYNNRVRKVSKATGTITTVAGIGTGGFSGDGGQATAAKLRTPSGIALDQAGNLYIADRTNHVIRRVDIAIGIITTIAGVGEVSGADADGKPATETKIYAPQGVGVDANGTVLFTDINHKLRYIDKGGIMQSLAGSSGGFSGDGGRPLDAKMNRPHSIITLPTGELLLADYNNHAIRKISSNYTVAINEKLAAGTRVVSMSAYEPDAQNISYSITAGNTHGAFAINASTGVLTVANSSALDFETTPVFNLSLGISDGALTTTVPLTITLNDLAKPVVSTTAATAIKGSSASMGGNISNEGGGAVTARGIEWGTAAGTYPHKVNMGSGKGSFAQAVTGLQAGTTYYYRAYATNDEGTAYGAEMNFTTPNGAPRITAQSFSLDEHAPNGTLVGKMLASDPDGQALTYRIDAGNDESAFAIDPLTGAITVANSSALDFEIWQDFLLLIKVSDGKAEAGAHAHISLNNLNDVAPVAAVAIGNQVVAEDLPFSFSFGTDAFTDPEGEELRYTASLANGEALPEWLSFSGTSRGFSGTALQLHVGVYNIKVTAADPDNNTASQLFTLSVQDVNDAPLSLSLSNNKINAGAASGTQIGTFATEDEDMADIHTYSLVPGEGATDNALFSIETNRLLTNTVLPVNGKTSYRVRVKVSDGQGASLEKDFTIQLEQSENEPRASAFLPNLFSPNGDGNNDRFILRAANVENARLRIFNRMGQLVYENSNVQQLLSQGWDGTQGGEPQPEGAYIWQLEGTLTDNTPLRIEGKSLGTIVLIR
ncbi:cadherin domain-containing protein [Cesiribacter sp. SM1]|uniref:NHL domain-containing protein n=1 Tax=Cesiribacter sp. SM1 TaxID=2861196 RepID=UPI001CD7F23A|nr:cadherin domain-containing protein [Cesiribacter sp. SM1]